MMHASVAVPDWPVAAATSAGQVGSDEPAAVLGVGGVVCANAWARRLGVRTGMRKREALSICPELVVVQRDVRRDALRFESVLRAVDAHVAHVVGRCACGRVDGGSGRGSHWADRRRRRL